MSIGPEAGMPLAGDRGQRQRRAGRVERAEPAGRPILEEAPEYLVGLAPLLETGLRQASAEHGPRDRRGPFGPLRLPTPLDRQRRQQRGRDRIPLHGVGLSSSYSPTYVSHSPPRKTARA